MKEIPIPMANLRSIGVPWIIGTAIFFCTVLSAREIVHRDPAPAADAGVPDLKKNAAVAALLPANLRKIHLYESDDSFYRDRPKSNKMRFTAGRLKPPRKGQQYMVIAGDRVLGIGRVIKVYKTKRDYSYCNLPSASFTVKFNAAVELPETNAIAVGPVRFLPRNTHPVVVSGEQTPLGPNFQIHWAVDLNQDRTTDIAIVYTHGECKRTKSSRNESKASLESHDFANSVSGEDRFSTSCIARVARTTEGWTTVERKTERRCYRYIETIYEDE